MPILERVLSPFILLVLLVLFDLSTSVISNDLASTWWLHPAAYAYLALLFLAMVAFDPAKRFQSWVSRLRGMAPAPVVTVHQPEPARGLIVLASLGKGIRSAECAVRYHYRGLHNERERATLERVWMLTTNAASAETADAAIERLHADHGIPRRLFTLVELGDDAAFHPLAVYHAVEAIYRSPAALALGPEQIVADYTGGTSTMSAGMVLAGAAPERRLEMMVPERFQDDGKADPSADSRPREVDLRFRLRRPKG